MRCWPSVVSLVLLAGCAATPGALPPSQGEGCTAYVAAWVGHFKANVAHLDGQRGEASLAGLQQARQALAERGIDEASCQRPYCIIQPKAGGRLDSYCGYRIADPSGRELYHWVPWTSALP